MSKLLSKEEAINLIQDGDTVVTAGFSLSGAVETLFKELKNKFSNEGSPTDLTLVHSAGISDRVLGIEHIADKGLFSRLIGPHWGNAPKWNDLIINNEVEAHCLPQGQMTHLMRAMASGKPGLFSKVGLGTFIDPRIEGGLMNEKARKKGSLVDVISIKDEEYLFYNSFPVNVALLRGTTADENGNITMEDEAIKLEALSVAQAVKRYGGKVIIQVKNTAANGTLQPKDVVIPGIYVDAVVVSDNPQIDHKMTANYFYNPVYSGIIKEPQGAMGTSELSLKKVIGRRGAMEITKDAIVNLGIGIPGDTIGPVASEEGLWDEMVLTVESGPIGGIPQGGNDFGTTKNAEAIIEHAYQFDHYTGTGVDITFMGTAQVDGFGNVNVSKFGPRVVGCGGFIDITQPAKKVVFLATFTAKGLEVEIKDGKLKIIQEGSVRKFVNHVDQITYSGKYGSDHNQPVLYVTERAVFQLVDGGVELIEYAPGIDVEKDIINQMGFMPKISSNLKEMPRELFLPGKIGIKEYIHQKGESERLELEPAIR